jgi:nitrogen fixation protein FixH
MADAEARLENEGQGGRFGVARWPLIIIGLLSIHVAGMLVAVSIATRDRSFAVMPDYYDRALNWDRAQAEKRASQKLGWKLQIEPAGAVDPTGRRRVRIRLIDAQGRPISPATIQITAYHHAHASQRQTIQFQTDADGNAQQAMAMPFAGFYQFDSTAAARGEEFTCSLTQYVSDEGPNMARGSTP